MQKINFQNLPSTTTPINATNLNAIQTNVEDVFNGTVSMGSIKTTGATVAGTLTTNNGGTFNFDLNNFGCLTYNNVNLDDYRTPGRYYFGTGCTNLPQNYCYVDIYGKGGDTAQVCYCIGSNKTYYRRRVNNAWQDWVEMVTEESGTWTPTMRYANVTYTRQVGTYKRHGKVVFFNCRLRGTINSSSSPYYAYIDGLPYAPNAVYAVTIAEHFNCCVNEQNLLAYVNNDSGYNYISLQRDTTAAGSQVAQWNSGLGTFYLTITGFYFID